jgi:hypothetical protein
MIDTTPSRSISVTSGGHSDLNVDANRERDHFRVKALISDHSGLFDDEKNGGGTKEYNHIPVQKLTSTPNPQLFTRQPPSRTVSKDVSWADD